MNNPNSKIIDNLYETDLALWFAQTIHALHNRNFDQVDWEYLIEEIESLVGRDNRELIK